MERTYCRDKDEDEMIVEMRTYHTKPGMRARFLEIFSTKSVPAHDEIGMKILGPFLSVEDPDTFFFMRGFPDLESREPMKAKFYEGELWKNELEAVLMPMLESTKSCWWRTRRAGFIGNNTNALITISYLRYNVSQEQSIWRLPKWFTFASTNG